MKRAFATLASGIQLHYRRAGSGSPVILLHPSPQSSSFSIPMAQRLACNFTAIAVDTPGYGLSDPLPGAPRSPALEDYVPALVEFLDALGIGKAAFYGNATGAEIAHLLAYAHPDRVALCMIDTAGHKEDADLNAMLAGYFPDVTPRRDGGHLLTHWDMVRSLYLFSPWQQTDRAHRLPIDLPSPAVIHEKMLDYLRAGEGYAAAYRPAFYTAKHALISRVTVPATLTRWEGKPDLSEVDELLRRGLPGNFTVLHAGPSMDQRLAASENYLLQHYRNVGSSAPEPALARPAAQTASSLQRELVDTPTGQLLVRACRAGRGTPLLALHDAGASSGSMLELLHPFVGVRPVIAIDYPGCGDSDANGAAAVSDLLPAYAAAIVAALQALGFARVFVIGRGLGGLVAVEIARIAPAAVRSIVQLAPLIFDATERASMQQNIAPDLSPRWDGSHLVTAWAIVRDSRLFWPWYRRTRAGVVAADADLNPGRLQRQVEDLLKTGQAWPNQWSEALAYPLLQRVAGAAVRTLFADEEGSPTASRLGGIGALLAPLPAHCQVLLDPLSRDPVARRAALQSWFDS